MANVPVGFRFHPTDEELIRHYLSLKNKDTKEASDAAAVVPEYDLYGEEEPWTIWESNGGADLYDQDLFFFTKLKKVNPHGTRINRKIGTGTWSEGEPSRPIFVEEKNNKKTPIGRKRKFRYENKSSEQHGCWYMEEYSLDGVKSADYVICRLRENNRSGGGGSGGNRDLLAVSVAASMEASGPIPVGFRFHPTDQELICYFLYNKNKGKGGRGLSLFMAATEAEDKTMALPPPPEEEDDKIKEDKSLTNGDATERGEAAAVTSVEEERKKDGEGHTTPAAAPVLLLEYMKSKEDEPRKEAEVQTAELVDVDTPELVEVEVEELGKKENEFLHEFDLFGSTEPWEIWEMFKGAELCNQDLFFFTQLKKVNPKGSRIGRKVGAGGTWSEGDVSKPIVDDRTGNPIGRKRKLRYEKVGSPHHACWYLDEYSLLDADIGDYVICRLRKNDKLAAAAFSSGEAASNNRKRKSAPSAAPPIPTQEPKHPPPTPATAEESTHPPTTAEESSQLPATAAESNQPRVPVEESNQPPPTAEVSKHPSTAAEESKQEEEDSNPSRAKRRLTTGLTQVEEAAADVLMSMANSTFNNNTLKLFGIEIGSAPTIGGE